MDPTGGTLDIVYGTWFRRFRSMTPEERESGHSPPGSHPPWLRPPLGVLLPVRHHSNSGLPLCICALWFWSKPEGTEEERQMQALAVGS